MSSINPFSFLLTQEGSYIFYYQKKPVIDQIENIGITVRPYADSTGETYNVYHYNDKRLGEYMSELTDSLRSFPLPSLKIKTKAARSIPTVDVTSGKEVIVNQKDTAAKQATDQAVASSKASTNNSQQNQVFNTVRDGYGTVADKNKVDSLTKNTGAYGGGTTSLVYPSDLLSNEYGYNGCYTVLFISEHNESTIGKLTSFTTDKKYAGSNVPGSEMQQNANNMLNTIIKSNDNDKDTVNNTVNVVAGVAGGAKIGTAVAGSKALKTFASSAIKGPVGALVGSLVALTAAGAGGVGASFIANQFKVTENIASYKQLNVAIALPTPALTDVHTLHWKDQSTAISGGIMQLAKSGKLNQINFGRLFSLDAFDELARVANLQQEKGEGLAENAAAAAQAAALGISKTGVGTALSLISGKSANPRSEMIFDTVGFRTFEMNFQLAARSTKDMENIESIIRVLKYHAYPELSTGNFMWIYPAHFDIVHYYRNDVNTHMPRHATSVLTDISVDYGGGQNFVSVHHDGSPVLINLKLTFKEIAVLSREDIAQGY